MSCDGAHYAGCTSRGPLQIAGKKTSGSNRHPPPQDEAKRAILLTTAPDELANHFEMSHLEINAIRVCSTASTGDPYAGE